MITTIVKFLLIICMVLTPVGAYLIIDTLTTYEQKKKIKKKNIIGIIIFLLLALSEIMIIIKYHFSIEYISELKEMTNYASILLIVLLLILLIVLIIIEKVKKIHISKSSPEKISMILALVLSFFAILVYNRMLSILVDTQEHEKWEHLDKTIEILTNNEGDSE